MLDDRFYMRPEYQSRSFMGWNLPVNTLVMISLVVAFVLQQINAAYIHSPAINYLVLTPQGLQHGYIWQLLTFQFLHVGFLHLFFNLIGLWFIGKFVEERLGAAHYLKIYFLGGVAGGLLQCALGWIFPSHFGGGVVGASAGIFGLVAAFSIIEPDATILAYFIIPIRAKYLLYFETAVTLFFMLMPPDGVAQAAHMGGILFAVGYLKWAMDWKISGVNWNPFRKKGGAPLRSAGYSSQNQSRRKSEREVSDLPAKEFMSSEVDPILDKISAHGIQSLTERERQILQAARAKMSKR